MNISLTSQCKPKEFTLKQMKDLISDIYTQKVKYDNKCLETKQAKETLEQYMYTYLNQLYGIKTIIEEYASAIQEGVKKYENQDAEIRLFGKILHSEIDDYFIQYVYNFKNGLKEIVKEALKRKMKYKTEAEINNTAENMFNGNTVLDDNLLRVLIQQVYSDNESRNEIRKKINELQKSKIIGLREKSESPIVFSELQNILLDNEISKQAKKCNKFSVLFKKIDDDNNGIINRDEFKTLISQIGLKIDIERTLKMLDPIENEQISFSDIFKFLNQVFFL